MFEPTKIQCFKVKRIARKNCRKKYQDFTLYYKNIYKNLKYAMDYDRLSGGKRKM